MGTTKLKESPDNANKKDGNMLNRLKRNRDVLEESRDKALAKVEGFMGQASTSGKRFYKEAKWISDAYQHATNVSMSLEILAQDITNEYRMIKKVKIDNPSNASLSPERAKFHAPQKSGGQDRYLTEYDDGEEQESLHDSTETSNEDEEQLFLRDPTEPRNDDEEQEFLRDLTESPNDDDSEDISFTPNEKGTSSSDRVSSDQDSTISENDTAIAKKESPPTTSSRRRQNTDSVSHPNVRKCQSFL